MIIVTGMRQEDGFTLLEVVVAIAILAGAFAVLYPIYGAAPQRMQMTEVRLQALHHAETYLEMTVLTGDHRHIARSEAAAQWQQGLEGWRLKLWVTNEESAKMAAGGVAEEGATESKLVTVQLLMQRQGGSGAPIELQRIFLARDSDE